MPARNSAGAAETLPEIATDIATVKVNNPTVNPVNAQNFSILYA